MPSHATSPNAWDTYARELGQNIQRERARIGYSIAQGLPTPRRGPRQAHRYARNPK